jgi:predicted nucleic acid-binding protein
LKLDAIPSGTRILIDSSIFIYHFTGASRDCRLLLERCEGGDVKGMTSVIVVAEVAHRLMMIEALARGLVTGTNIARKLREKPEVVRKLRVYQEQVERIPLMGIDVVPVGLKTLVRSAQLRNRYGLLTNDSLVATAAQEEQVAALASADRDFGRIENLQLFQPADLG